MAWRVSAGVSELAAAYAERGLTYDDFQSSRFVRLRRINELLSAGLRHGMMRRPSADPFPPPGALAAPGAR